MRFCIGVRCTASWLLSTCLTEPGATRGPTRNGILQSMLANIPLTELGSCRPPNGPDCRLPNARWSTPRVIAQSVTLIPLSSLLTGYPPKESKRPGRRRRRLPALSNDP